MFSANVYVLNRERIKMTVQEGKNMNINESNARLVFSTNILDDQECFFGYYTSNPWNKKLDKLLAHCIPKGSVKTYFSKYDDVVVGYFDFPKGTFNQIAKTTACNWQIGSQLQWLPCECDELVIFNTRQGVDLRAIIVDINNGVQQILPRPIYAVHPNGKVAFGLNMQRLYFTRKAYSYDGDYENLWRQEIVENDGIYQINLDSGAYDLLIRTRDIAALDPIYNMRGALHWLDHPTFSPNGKYFLFYHRWLTNNGIFFSRLYTCESNGKRLYRYPDSGMYSHATWLSNDQFIVYGRLIESDIRYSQKHPWKRFLIEKLLPLYKKANNISFMKNLRRRLLKDHYLLFSVGDDKHQIIGEKKLTEDGHPSVCPIRRNLLLLDTYPDSDNYRHLYIYDIITENLYLLGKFVSPKQHTASSPDRCDLHPRWSSDGKLICFDSIHEGSRHMYVLEIADHILNKT